jgi:probable HAF family extracellular repeat protein
MKDLGLLPPKPGFVSDGGYAVAINNLGEILGFSVSSNAKEYYDGPFLYVGGKMYDLNSLLPSNNGYTMTNPIGINDFGVIVAEATRAGDSATALVHTVILTPVL